MFENLIFRDRRLSGSLPFFAAAAYTCNLDATTPLSSAFSRVSMSNTLNGGKLDNIFILCHGFAGSNPNAGMSMDAGGSGLQLGRENVLHSNVALWEAIKNKTTNIVVYSCAAGNTEAENVGTRYDGKYLMGALAIHTNANVYAADRIQWYNTRGYNFGRWEGQLFHFPPDGSNPREVSSPPMELSAAT
jgi:hypothetical protein